ncbi:MAG: hypothetical protein OHK0029_29470 [Armatimonadaceae bacterium]
MLTVPEQAARMTWFAMEGIFEAAWHIPKEKRLWSPMADARSAHSQLVECAAAPILHLPLIEGDTNAYVAENFARYQAATQALQEQSWDEIRDYAREKHTLLVAAIRSVPNQKLEEVRMLPFNGGMQVTGADVLFLPYWNIVYHTGQINYIQTMLGDKEMH